MTEIARNGGSGGSASSVDFWDGSDPFRPNAWYVFRMNDATLESGSANPTGYSGSRTYPWYIYVQWLRGDNTQNWNAYPATPSALETSSTITYNGGVVGVQFCIPVGTIAGTSEAPWNGSGTLGENLKGSPVWRTTAGTPTGFQGSYVFPRANNPGGAYSSVRQTCANLVSFNSTTTAPGRCHFIADDDSLILLTNVGDNANDWTLNYFGLYNVRPGITIDYPMVHIQGGLPLGVTNTVYGPTSGAYPGGGFPMNAVATEGVRGLILSRYDEFFDQYSSPNKMFASEQYDEWKIPIGLYENPSYYGYAGEIDLLRELYNWSPNDANIGRTRLAFGTNTPQGVKLTVPWNGSTIPRSNFTRAGINFP
jgi:hypothetical protein